MDVMNKWVKWMWTECEINMKSVWRNGWIGWNGWNEWNGWNGCDINVKWMWNECKMNMKWIWIEYEIIMNWIWSGCGTDVEWIWNQYEIKMNFDQTFYYQVSIPYFSESIWQVFSLTKLSLIVNMLLLCFCSCFSLKPWSKRTGPASSRTSPGSSTWSCHSSSSRTFHNTSRNLWVRWGLKWCFLQLQHNLHTRGYIMFILLIINTP